MSVLPPFGHKMKNDLNEFFDAWNRLGFVFLVGLAVVLFTWYGFSTLTLLAFLTTVFAFVGFNQMREDRSHQETVTPLAARPHFEEMAEGTDFGLQISPTNRL